jgi:hypothetical protein
MGKYKLPSYPNSENQDKKNNDIMAKMRELREAGTRIEAVSIFNVNPGPPSVVPDMKNTSKKSRK